MPPTPAFWPAKLRGGSAIALALWTLAFTDAMPSCACVCVSVGAADTYFYLTMFHVASDMAFEITLSGTQQFTKASGTLSTSTWWAANQHPHPQLRVAAPPAHWLLPPCCCAGTMWPSATARPPRRPRSISMGLPLLCRAR